MCPFWGYPEDIWESFWVWGGVKGHFYHLRSSMSTTNLSFRGWYWFWSAAWQTLSGYCTFFYHFYIMLFVIMLSLYLKGRGLNFPSFRTEYSYKLSVILLHDLFILSNLLISINISWIFYFLIYHYFTTQIDPALSIRSSNWIL